MQPVVATLLVVVVSVMALSVHVHGMRVAPHDRPLDAPEVNLMTVGAGGGTEHLMGLGEDPAFDCAWREAAYEYATTKLKPGDEHIAKVCVCAVGARRLD